MSRNFKSYAARTIAGDANGVSAIDLGEGETAPYERFSFYGDSTAKVAQWQKDVNQVGSGL